MKNMAEKTWNSLNVGGDKGPEFLKLNPGITQVRFASNPYEVFLHWEKTRDGLTDKINEVLAGLSQEDRDAMMDQAVASQPVSN